MKYIVDIDGTLCTLTKNLEYERAEPLHANIEKINTLYKQGNEIYLWTARGTVSAIDFSELTKNQLDDWGVKYHSLNFGKPDYTVWIDDKCINIKDLEVKK